MLQGKYGAKVVRPSAEERLDVIKAGRQPRSESAPLASMPLHPNSRKWVLEHLGDRPDTNVVRLILGHQFQGSLGYYARRGSIVPPLLDKLPQPTPHLPMCG